MVQLLQQRGDSAEPQPARPRHLLAVPNVTGHTSTASVPISVLLSNSPLPCGFNVPVKGLNRTIVFTLFSRQIKYDDADWHNF